MTTDLSQPLAVNTALDLAPIRQKALDSLYFFAKGILGFNWLDPTIHLPICRELENPTNTRLVVILPRGWLKTTLATIAFSIWWSVRNPNTRILLVQNSSTNATKKLSVIRSQWETNPLLRALFPDLLPGRNSVWKSDALCLTRSASFPEATYEAAGTSTRVVSRHYDVVIEDDTVAPDFDELNQESLAPTHDDVEKAIGWHKLVLPLFNNPETDRSIVVGTRWYDQDLLQWIMDNEPSYKIITRACKEDTEGRPDPKGRLTYPSRFSDRVLEQLEASLGPYMFHCLYYNTPVRRDDMTFRPEWFQYYDVPPKALAVYTTIDSATDPALATSVDTDYSVVMTCGKDLNTGYIYVLDYFRRRCNPGEFAQAIFDHVRKYRPIMVGYQDIAFERSIHYWLTSLMRQHSLHFYLEKLPISRTRDSKHKMITGLQPLYSSGTIRHRTHMKELESELLKFPLGAHDDLPDALAMQLVLWRATRKPNELIIQPDALDLSVDAALAEFESRARGATLKSPVFDPFHFPASLLHN